MFWMEKAEWGLQFDSVVVYIVGCLALINGFLLCTSNLSVKRTAGKFINNLRINFTENK